MDRDRYLCESWAAGRTLQQMADALGVSRQRAWQLVESLRNRGLLPRRPPLRTPRQLCRETGADLGRVRAAAEGAGAEIPGGRRQCRLTAEQAERVAAAVARPRCDGCGAFVQRGGRACRRCHNRLNYLRRTGRLPR